MIGAILIVSFYTLVIGWILKYAYLSISGNLYPDLNTSSAEFGKLISSDFVSQFVCFTLIF